MHPPWSWRWRALDWSTLWCCEVRLIMYHSMCVMLAPTSGYRYLSYASHFQSVMALSWNCKFDRTPPVPLRTSAFPLKACLMAQSLSTKNKGPEEDVHAHLQVYRRASGHHCWASTFVPHWHSGFRTFYQGFAAAITIPMELCYNVPKV